MKTPKIKDPEGNIYPSSVAEIKKLTIGGIDQYLMIRGKDTKKPIILFVHGGPGQAEIGYIREYQKSLEEHFVVVRWDQRGAGLSYSKTIPKDTFTIETFVEDLNEVTDYLIQRFNQQKIIIAGHSWGTVIATYAVKRCPEKYSAYIGIGQVINSEEAEKIAYHYTKSQAIKQNNKKVLKKLEQIGEPPYSHKEVMIRAICQGEIGGVVKTNPPRSMGLSLLLSREYNLIHKLNYQKNCLNSANTMYPQIAKINFFNEIKNLEVPTLFVAGQYDYISPTILVKQFYDELEAPIKDLIVLENSAHLPQLEECERFIELLIKSNILSK